MQTGIFHSAERNGKPQRKYKAYLSPAPHGCCAGRFEGGWGGVHTGAEVVQAEVQGETPQGDAVAKAAEGLRVAVQPDSRGVDEPAAGAQQVVGEVGGAGRHPPG